MPQDFETLKANFVRDVCSVVPKSKSEVRERLDELLEEQERLTIKRVGDIFLKLAKQKNKPDNFL